MLFPSKSPPHCRTKIQKQSDKLYNPATWMNLIESDRVLKRAQKNRNHLIFNIRNLFTRVYQSIFLARFPSSWGKEVLIFSCSKGTISWFLFQIKQKYRTTIKYFCRDFVQPTWLLSLLPPFWVGNKATRARSILSNSHLFCLTYFVVKAGQKSTFARGRKKVQRFSEKVQRFSKNVGDFFENDGHFLTAVGDLCHSTLFFEEIMPQNLVNHRKHYKFATQR